WITQQRQNRKHMQYRMIRVVIRYKLQQHNKHKTNKRKCTFLKTEKDKMIAGELYNPLNETLIENRRHARNLTYMYNQTLDEEKTKRHQLLTELFGSLGSQIEVEPHFHCDYGYNIHVGENFYANFNCVILDVCHVQFGRNCMLGPAVQIYTATHPLDSKERISGKEYGKSIS